MRKELRKITNDLNKIILGNDFESVHTAEVFLRDLERMEKEGTGAEFKRLYGRASRFVSDYYWCD